MLIPIRTCSLYNQTPFPNWGIIGATVLAFLATVSSGNGEWILPLVLQDASLTGLVGHMFLHGGIFHLAGNMMFLWVFGNAVCAKTGPWFYIPVYLLCGIGGAVCHLLISDIPMIGASGAINGIIAFYLVLQPVNDVEMLFIFFLRGKRFSIAGFWVILYWLAWDIFGLSRAEGSGVAFTAHVGGFATGFLLGHLFVLLKLVKMDEYDNPTLPEYLGLLRKGWSSPSQSTRDPEPAAAAHRPAAEAYRPPPPPSSEPLPPLKPFADEAGPGSESRLSAENMQAFDCPHCQASLELNMTSLPASKSLLCPACKGTIDLVLE